MALTFATQGEVSPSGDLPSVTGVLHLQILWAEVCNCVLCVGVNITIVVFCVIYLTSGLL